MAFSPNPFDQMDRMMDQFRHSMVGMRPSWGEWEGGFGHDTHVTLETDEDGYVVLADLPGFEKEEIDLRFEDGLLTIRAEHETTAEYAGGQARSARSRHVHEQLRIPEAVVEDEIAASYRNGVLEVHLPTVEALDDESTAIDIE